MPYFFRSQTDGYRASGASRPLPELMVAKFSTEYARLPALDVFVARASNQDEALADARRSGNRWSLIAASPWRRGGDAIVCFTGQRSREEFERVSEGVEAIAQGKLDHHIDLRSRDDLKPLADNVELMTKQLREQIAREAESRQFQSFVRLSAVLTHDLKNAIGALVADGLQHGTAF